MGSTSGKAVIYDKGAVAAVSDRRPARQANEQWSIPRFDARRAPLQKMKRTAIVYELLPAKPERELFCEIIRIFCKELRAPNFEPHLTLFVTDKSGMSPRKVLQSVRCRPIRLSARKTAFSRKFTKTLFVRFKSTPSLRKLAKDLARTAGVAGSAPTDPHVSLLYKKISSRVQRELARTIKLPFRTVTFDSIAAVRLTLPVRTGTQIGKWKMVAKRSLRR